MSTVQFNGLWCKLHCPVYYCERQGQSWCAVCPCNTTPQAPGCWNVLTTVNCRPFPLLTLSSSRAPEGALRRTAPDYKAESVWFLYCVCVCVYHTFIAGSPWCCAWSYWAVAPEWTGHPLYIWCHVAAAPSGLHGGRLLPAVSAA